MKKRLALLFALILSFSSSYAQKKWTLQDCIDYAMANNITLKKSQLQKLSVTEDLKGAKAALLPTLNASTNQSLGYILLFFCYRDIGVHALYHGNSIFRSK